MSKYVIDGTTLSAIADAVREKGGTTEKILVSDIASAIDAIETGGGGELPAELFEYTGDLGSYAIAGSLGDAMLNLYGNKFNIHDVTNFQYLFAYCMVDLSGMTITGCNSMGQNMFAYFKGELPTLIGNVPKTVGLQRPWGYYEGSEIPKRVYEQLDWSERAAYMDSTTYGANCLELFNNCNYLREIPMDFVKSAIECQNHCRATPSIWNTGYYYLFGSCYVANRFIDIPVSTLTMTQNTMSYMFDYCGCAQDITFETNEDGTPKTANWSNQTISLNTYLGWLNNSTPAYNAGMKSVSSDATYAQYKDDVDNWYTQNASYSKYNHDSAVRTINSLPDTSAFGTNIIKFKGTAGEKTDGGAINTLTEEEIAVATAKGWTVTLV